MDTDRKLRLLKDQKGMTIVFIAITIVLLCLFLGLAVDIGHVFVAKNQLQNAADSAALAGASKLAGGDLVQTAARTEAVSYAGNNKADTSNVRILSTGANTLSDDNDITVGNWNPARPLNYRYQPGATPVNAVQVSTRKTDSSPNGPVGLFFSRVFGWNNMPVSASAIATRSPMAGFYFMIGRSVCSGSSGGSTVTLSPPVVLSAGNDNMAWTSLLDNVTSAREVKDDYVCPANKLPDVEVCGKSVYTTNGVDNTVFKGVETDFYDPDYDRINKTFRDSVVATWTVIVPVSMVNDPSVQPTPQPVYGYAKIRLIRACGAGNNYGCGNDRPFRGPTCNGSDTFIVIDQITCIDCANSSILSGVRPGLVQ